MTSPDLRRALRNLAMIAVVFVLLAMVWQWSARLDSAGLREALRWALGIVALFSLSTGCENGLRALRLHAGRDGFEIEAGARAEDEP
jgi:hypothetical protein